jgi:hypothetical protein
MIQDLSAIFMPFVPDTFDFGGILYVCRLIGIGVRQGKPASLRIPLTKGVCFSKFLQQLLLSQSGGF